MGTFNPKGQSHCHSVIIVGVINILLIFPVLQAPTVGNFHLGSQLFDFNFQCSQTICFFYFQRVQARELTINIKPKAGNRNGLRQIGSVFQIDHYVIGEGKIGCFGKRNFSIGMGGFYSKFLINLSEGSIALFTFFKVTV